MAFITTPTLNHVENNLQNQINDLDERLDRIANWVIHLIRLQGVDTKDIHDYLNTNTDDWPDLIGSDDGSSS